MKLINIENKKEVEWDESGDLTIGRGEYSGCLDKRVSKKHAMFTKSFNGEITMLAIHVNPCFVMEGGKPPVVTLRKGDSVIVQNGDCIGLVVNGAWFRVIIGSHDAAVKAESYPLPSTSRAIANNRVLTESPSNNDTIITDDSAKNLKSRRPSWRTWELGVKRQAMDQPCSSSHWNEAPDIDHPATPPTPMSVGCSPKMGNNFRERPISPDLPTDDYPPSPNYDEGSIPPCSPSPHYERPISPYQPPSPTYERAISPCQSLSPTYERAISPPSSPSLVAPTAQLSEPLTVDRSRQECTSQDLSNHVVATASTPLPSAMAAASTVNIPEISPVALPSSQAKTVNIKSEPIDPPPRVNTVSEPPVVPTTTQAQDTTSIVKQEVSKKPVASTVDSAVQTSSTVSDEATANPAPQNPSIASVPDVGASANTAGQPLGGPRVLCQYQQACYRTNPHHKATFSHPGDPDWIPIERRMMCQYDPHCFRASRAHRVNWRHTCEPGTNPPVQQEPTTPPLRSPSPSDADDDAESVDSFLDSFIDDNEDLSDPYATDDDGDEEYMPTPPENEE